MLRSIFLALGIMAIIVGLQSMVVESVELYSAAGTDASSFIDPSGRPSQSTRTWVPGEWFPWIMLMGGAVGMLYAVNLPKRFNRGDS